MEENDRLIGQSGELGVDVRDNFRDAALSLVFFRRLKSDLYENHLRTNGGVS